ncbi:hypothetical protein SAMN05443633_11367 [Chryseobacterium arachidis]|uniref:Glycosyltransferase RgtA/B/C/D-like domain-containing protein n=3 Tax=Chryseobacterium arachidis TaxID=1416778 RepID=A0A1M5IVB9_9FLAO|nr:hypothetical protein SAMN05443633_11367 [Chryseobacterium arachidis]
MNFRPLLQQKSVNTLYIVLTLFPLLCIIYHLKDTFLDDSYITLTYSKHLFYEGQPLYNTADTIHGNGQTSVLWMLIESLFFYLKSVNPIYLNKLLSLLFSLIIFTSLFVSFKKQKFLPTKFFILLFSVFYSYWSALNVSHGLETLLFAATLLLFLQHRSKSITYLLAFLLPFIRPEAIVITFFYIFDTKLFSKYFFWRLLIVLSSIFTYILYLWFFYDFLIPLPLLLKNTQEFSAVRIRNFIIMIAIFSPIFFYCLKNYKTKFFFYLPLFFFIVYYSFFIDEVMNFFGRYQYPLFIYFVYFLQDEKVKITAHKITDSTLYILSSIGIYQYYNFINNHKNFYENTYSAGLKNGPVYLGTYLKQRSIQENQKLKIINSDAGAIAYFSECYLYDTWGLNNATLLQTKKNRNWTAYIAYLKNISPHYIILISKESHTFVPKLDFEDKIYKHFKLKDKSPELIRKFDNNYYYFLYKVYD